MSKSSANLYDGEMAHQQLRKGMTMNFKFIPILVGAIASFSFANALTIVAPLKANAQTNQPTRPVPPQQAPSQPRQGGEIQLTPQQQQQLIKVRSETRAQIEKVLTAKQQQQLKTALQSGQNPREAFTALKLTQEQQTQLQGILQTAQAKSEAILTPQQRQQLQQSVPQQPQRPAK